MMSRTTAAIMACMAILVVFIVKTPLFAQANKANPVRIGGASLLCGHMESMYKLFQETAPNCNFAVLPSNSETGLKDLAAGRVGMTIATREASEKEVQRVSSSNKTLKGKMVGSVSLAIVINKANKINSLTFDQVKAIFSGKISDWKDVGERPGEIRVLAQPSPGTGAGVAFEKIVLQGEPYAINHQVVKSFLSLVKICGKDVNAIGYIPTTTVFFKNSAKQGMKVIALQEKENGPLLFPKYGASKGAYYPIKMPFYLYWDAASNNGGCLEGLVNYIDKQTM